jgi:hypothetical protein
MKTTIYYHPETGEILQAMLSALAHQIMNNNLPSIVHDGKIRINQWRVNTTTLELEPIV